MLSLQRTQVPSLSGKLRSHELCSAAGKKKKGKTKCSRKQEDKIKQDSR